MMILSMVSLLVGAVLGQRFTVMVLIPATAVVLALAVGTGVTHAHTAWSVVLMIAAATTCMQIGYFAGIGIRHVLPAASSGRSSPLPARTTSARHAAQ